MSRGGDSSVQRRRPPAPRPDSAAVPAARPRWEKGNGAPGVPVVRSQRYPCARAKSIQSHHENSSRGLPGCHLSPGSPRCPGEHPFFPSRLLPPPPPQGKTQPPAGANPLRGSGQRRASPLSLPPGAEQPGQARTRYLLATYKLRVRDTGCGGGRSHVSAFHPFSFSSLAWMRSSSSSRSLALTTLDCR